MSKILTVAKLVLQESLRKKILFVLGLFFLILLVSSPFLDTVRQEDKVKLVERISFSSLAFFGILAAIFLPAASLPGEIEEKLIQAIMTKPIGRLNFLLGKILGFVSIIGFLFILMGILSWALIQITAKGTELSAKRSFSAQHLTFIGGDSDKIKPLEKTVQQGKIAWLVGPQDIRAVWSWERLNRSLTKGEATFRVINTLPAGGAESTKLEIRGFSLQGMIQDQRIVVENDKPINFAIDVKDINPKDLAESRGEFQIEVQRLDKDYAIGLKKDAVKILASPGSFHLNFLKGILLLFFEVILMVVITVAGSTFLSSAVTISLSLFIYLSGHMIEFLKTVLRTMTTTGIMSVPYSQNPLVETVEKHSSRLMEVFTFFLHWFTTLFPNLKRFEVSSSIVAGIDVPSSLLTSSFIYMSVYAFIALIVAYLFFRRKEF